VLGRALFYIALLLVVPDSDFSATPQLHDAPRNKVPVQRIIFHSPVPLTALEHRKLNKSIREFGLDTAEELVREMYQDKGYLMAKVSAELVPARTSGLNANALLLQVRPGKQYHLVRISWSGITVFSESEVEKLIPGQPGEIFNRTKIAEGLNAARKLYDSRGYINFTCVPTPEVDEEAATVGFVIDVSEGGPFHFGELDVEGMEASHREILLTAWQGLRGRTYNSGDADNFFNRFFRSPRPAVKPENYATRNIDEFNHSVNYSLKFEPSLRYRMKRNSQLELVEQP
jgi:outer membrane protein assembly factor BamA